MDGWIKLHRKFLTWEWYQDANTLRVFLHLILKANHKDGKWQGVDVQAGQLLTGRLKLAQELNLSERQIRTSLNRLKSTNEVTIKTTKQYSIITLNNWDAYQQNDQQNDQQATNKRPTNDQQTTTNKNDKKYKNDKNEKNININNLTESERFFISLQLVGYKFNIDPKYEANQLYIRLKNSYPGVNLAECVDEMMDKDVNNQASYLKKICASKLEEIKQKGKSQIPEPTFDCVIPGVNDL